MPYIDSDSLMNAARTVPILKKRDWILQHVAGRRVLDLGVVGNDIDRALRADETWLHGLIEKAARHVTGIDIDERSVRLLNAAGHNVICADAVSVRLDERFDVIVCGDLIEHVAEPLRLLETVAYHLADGGLALVTTPNPHSASRIFNIWADGSTPVNPEHVFWLCPRTMHQLVARSGLAISDIVWLTTDYPAATLHRVGRRVLDPLARLLSR